MTSDLGSLDVAAIDCLVLYEAVSVLELPSRCRSNTSERGSVLVIHQFREQPSLAALVLLNGTTEEDFCFLFSLAKFTA